MMTKIKQRWQNYSKREQIIFSLGGLVLLGLALSQGAIAPLNNYRQQSEQNLRQAQRDFAMLMQQQDRISHLHAQRPLQYTLSLDRAVHESARQNNLKIILQETQKNRAVLAPLVIPFPQLLSWLELLETEYGIQARHLKVAIDEDNPNQVYISSLVLQRTAAVIL
ncbi:type II secretion system protein GspM [Yersinia hibernica]|nr:type II secretion system protein GspM [Yersinia hibernica]